MFNFLKKKEKQVISLKVRRELLEELLKNDAYKLLLDEMEDVATEMHKALIAGKIPLNFYKGFISALQLFSNYANDIIIECKIQEEEDENEL